MGLGPSAGLSSEQFHHTLRVGCRFAEVVSALIEIEQPGTKQTARQQVAIMQSLYQFRE
jgi:hypothetical protein